MNKKLIIWGTAAIFAALLCGCSGKNVPKETETSATTVSEDNSYALVRPWTGSELLGSIFYCGEYRPLPIAAEENNGDLPETVFFENGSAAAKYDEAGNIIGLRFERDSAPDDFSVYGVDFSSVPSDIPEKAGIANSISGSPEETVIYSFYGGGITELTFVYAERKLASVYIEA